MLTTTRRQIANEYRELYRSPLDHVVTQADLEGDGELIQGYQGCHTSPRLEPLYHALHILFAIEDEPDFIDPVTTLEVFEAEGKRAVAVLRHVRKLAAMDGWKATFEVEIRDLARPEAGKVLDRAAEVLRGVK